MPSLAFDQLIDSSRINLGFSMFYRFVEYKCVVRKKIVDSSSFEIFRFLPTVGLIDKFSQETNETIALTD
jgi:hypothetical protein